MFNAQTGAETVKILSAEEAEDRSQYIDPETGVELEVRNPDDLFVDWLADNYKQFGTHLEFVTNKSQEGSQFVRGFGGIGGLLRYASSFLPPRHACLHIGLKAVEIHCTNMHISWNE